ncbi:hypothetical protein PSTEL_14860 [Paenibacillus stellifer]|uniref:DUF4183 domain-containing protein n=1 Tax=Paenibacillus stellifer TaxID=169760 RepID=A0A089LRI6_9BACL|nr:DUF4183 domain-containing protein [Paenibacillus stellifer]AIQ64166.1 hypothetical protein PSTEL_14860 [Paenibacillus stellifer]
MAASLIKLFVSATASAPVATGGAATTTITPAVTRYNAAITADMITASNTTIPADSFLDDTGAAISAFPSVPSTAYIHVYVNGVIQEAGLSSLSTTQLVLSTTSAPAGAPVNVVITDLTNVSSPITTEPTISAPTITIQL